jgi:competence ComEA-like helix-hairpin-helix protein
MDVRSRDHRVSRWAPHTRTTGLALLCCLLAPGSALAQGAATGAFSITPARRNLVARPPTSLVPTHVANSTTTPYAVTVFPVLLAQDLTGAFTFSSDARDLQEASTILSPSLKSFLLEPGTSQNVSLRWNLLPVSSRAAYIGIVFQGEPRAAGHSVSVISRLLSINFLRLPGVYHSNGVFTGLPVTQFAPQVLRLLPRVKNTGDVIDSPQHGRLLIRDAAGHAVYKTHWTGDVILPGAVREFPIDVKQLLGAGTYTAIAAMSFGANHNAKISTTFTLVGPNALPSPNVSIIGFAGQGGIGDPAHITAKVHSTGTAPVTFDLKLALYRLVSGLAGNTPVATTTVHFASLAPKSTTDLDEQLGKLQPGQYHVIGSYTDPTGAPQQLISDFTATKHVSFWDRIKNFFSDHAVLLISLLALLLLAAALARLLRRQRHLEAALAAGAARSAAAPAPGFVVPAAAGRVSINSASAEELETVPGIGPRAASRIVSHREEFGDFASLAELARVEGFDSQRVAELREQLRV